jgi:YD repeat-containing protein
MTRYMQSVHITCEVSTFNDAGRWFARRPHQRAGIQSEGGVVATMLFFVSFFLAVTVQLAFRQDPLETLFRGGSPARALRRILRHCGAVLFLCTVSVSAQSNNYVNNLTSVPVPGVGHEYIQELSEIVNPANGSLSIRIQAPRPKERALNFPLYAFMYDSTQQFSLQPHETTSGQSYDSNCGPDTAPYGGADTLPLNCIESVQFYYQSINAGQGISSLLSGPNSIISSHVLYSVLSQTTLLYTNCDLLEGISYEDPDGVIQDLGAFATPQGDDTANLCNYFGITPSPVGGETDYKILLVDKVTGLGYGQSLPSNTFTSEPYGFLINTHGDAIAAAIQGVSVPAPAIEDANGNAPDTTGRSGTYQSFQPWGDALAATANRTFPGGATYGYTWGTATLQWAPTSTDVTGTTDNLCAAGGNGAYISNPVVTAMTTPESGLQPYTFLYDDPYGLLSQITYPTGAWVKYSWGVNSLSDATGYVTPPAGLNAQVDPVHQPLGTSVNTSCIFRHDTPAIQKRVVSFDGVHPAEEQDFTYSTQWLNGEGVAGNIWTSKQTKVMTKDLLTSGTPTFTTIYNYIPLDPQVPFGSHLVSSPMAVEGSIIYEDTNGNILKTVTKSWNYYDQLASECTTLPNGKTSGTFYQYQGYPTWVTSYYPTAQTTNLPTDVAEYDYGLVSTPCQQPTTTPTRETKTTYASFGNTPLWPSLTASEGGDPVTVSLPPLSDRVSTVVTYSNGSRVAETDYSYDQTATTGVSGTGTIVGHDGNNYGTGQTSIRGNPTTITRQCFTSSVSCSSPRVQIVYDITGQPVTVTDGNGNQTQVSYADNYTTDDGTPPSGSNTNTYIKTITRPPTDGVSHVTSYQWDFDKGEVRTSIDENLNTTTYQYNDPWYRLTLAQYPDGGSISYNYTDAGPEPTITKTLLESSSGQSVTTETWMDGMAHPIEVATQTDPVGPTYVMTTYDGIGRIASRTNPYRSSDTQYSTKFQYDALNRMTVQQNPDGTGRQWCYNDVASSGQGNCTSNLSASAPQDEWEDVSDENGNHWQHTSDALGRMTSVLEPNGSSAAPSMETDYSYDGLNDLLSVVQNGNGSSTVSRLFAYNSLSQLIAANNPEASSAVYPPAQTCTGAGTGQWTTCYSYDQNGNLISKTDNRGISINYNYDALNRLLSKTYSGDFNHSPWSCYQYDQSSGSSASAYLVGHLTNEWTETAGTSCAAIAPSSGFLTLRAISAYDPMGRIWNEQQCTPAGCYTSTACLSGHSYWYDLAGNLTCSTNGIPDTPGSSAPLTFTSVFDGAERLQALQSSWTPNSANPNAIPNPACIFQAQVTTSPSIPVCTQTTSTPYSAFGGLMSGSYGNGAVTLNRSYDNRLRVTGETDNGNVPQ